MIKGDLRKKQILETAEALFSEKGYEQTGVQDILDVLHLSKGSFYHHFESKEQVLQRICENRARLTAMKTEQNASSTGLERMNAVLSGMFPFRGEGLAFLKMILPVFILPEGKSIRSGYQDALKNCFLPLAEDAVRQMIQEGSGFVFYPEATAGMVLDLMNDLWAEISRVMIQSEKETAHAASLGQLLSLVDPYRAGLENMLTAPYGSLNLISLEELNQVVNQIHNWWMVEPSEEENPISDKEQTT